MHAVTLLFVLILVLASLASAVDSENAVLSSFFLPLHLRQVETRVDKKQSQGSSLHHKQIPSLSSMFGSSPNTNLGNGNNTSPFFQFIPLYLGSNLVNLQKDSKNTMTSLVFRTGCFGHVNITAEIINPTTQQSIEISIYTSQQLVPNCQDQYQFWAPGFPLKFMGPQSNTVQRFTWMTSNLTSSERWYLANFGIRCFLIPPNPIISIAATGALFEGFVASPPLSSWEEDLNLDFLANYVHANGSQGTTGNAPVRRSAGSTVASQLNPDLIESGDVFMVLRLDGLDPSLAWLMGSSTAHSAIAIRPPTNLSQLLICEANVKSSFWPKDGVQCSEYSEWVQMAETAQLNVLWAPIKKDASSSSFNSTAAMEYITGVEGFAYGMPNFLFSWWDVPEDNYPCLPPTFTRCEQTPFEELKMILLDNFLQDSPQNVYRQAISQRAKLPLTTPVLDAVKHFAEAANTKTPFIDLVTMPESDAWRYNTTRNGQPAIGPSLVCSAFTCSVWKAAGLISQGLLNCTEQTPWDLNSMQVYDSGRMGENRPAVCKEADPSNPLCQLMGSVTLNVGKDFNTRPLVKGMGSRCPSKAPLFERPQYC